MRNLHVCFIDMAARHLNAFKLDCHETLFIFNTFK